MPTRKDKITFCRCIPINKNIVLMPFDFMSYMPITLYLDRACNCK